MGSILVLGAGELGSAVLESLARHRDGGSACRITLATRRGSSEVASRLGDISQIKCDVGLASETGLAQLFKSFDTLIGCTGLTAPAGTQSKICRAALQAQVRHFFPWQFGLDYDTIGRGSSQDLFTEQLDVRAMLRGQSTTEWVIVSVGMFADLLFQGAFGLVTKPSAGSFKVMALRSWQSEMTVTSPSDIGTVVAEIALEDWEAVKNGVVFVAGDTLSYEQLAQAVDRVSNSRSTRELRTEDDVAKLLEKDPSNEVLKYHGVWAAGRGVAWDVEDTYNARKGMTLETAEQYLRKNFEQILSSA